MNINNYIESGIIERYLLGLASADEEAELFALRKIYPILDIEFAAAEIRIENKCHLEAKTPPPALRQTILNRFKNDDADFNTNEETYSRQRYRQQPPKTDTYILEPFWKRRMSVSIWWRCIVIAMVILLMALAASTYHFYRQASRFEDALIKKVSSPNSSSR
ncbi:hypothetical protein DVR12_09555 [Chitinophaga silvatica]|uniref:Uncharacterized protein n=1 Tax=Chitinophaga silvatica TaxID=2282649 RepID=A0A3E1YB32_9BACT|nr:hypothetical protein [Chitinophaga silvatica]RFS23256.1 hypothetical protein DVR12_09555 [Chitinophaga silvatica]